jgi:hypothetical protein
MKSFLLKYSILTAILLGIALVTFVNYKQSRIITELNRIIQEKNQKLMEHDTYCSSQMTFTYGYINSFVSLIKSNIHQFNDFSDRNYVVIIPESACGDCINSLFIQLKWDSIYNNNTFVIANVNSNEYYRLWVSLGFRKENFIKTDSQSGFSRIPDKEIVVVRTNDDFDIDLWMVYNPKYSSQLQAFMTRTQE